ncbi:hypothetical protein SNEBB_005055 [Seison nebaliae]|nr:hypothetical protein SNEBB_005055 [Seison nebaliae]
MNNFIIFAPILSCNVWKVVGNEIATKPVSHTSYHVWVFICIVLSICMVALLIYACCTLNSHFAFFGQCCDDEFDEERPKCSQLKKKKVIYYYVQPEGENYDSDCSCATFCPFDHGDPCNEIAPRERMNVEYGEYGCAYDDRKMHSSIPSSPTALEAHLSRQARRTESPIPDHNHRTGQTSKIPTNKTYRNGHNTSRIPTDKTYRNEHTSNTQKEKSHYGNRTPVSRSGRKSNHSIRGDGSNRSLSGGVSNHSRTGSNHQHVDNGRSGYNTKDESKEKYAFLNRTEGKSFNKLNTVKSGHFGGEGAGRSSAFSNYSFERFTNISPSNEGKHNSFTSYKPWRKDTNLNLNQPIGGKTFESRINFSNRSNNEQKLNLMGMNSRPLGRSERKFEDIKNKQFPSLERNNFGIGLPHIHQPKIINNNNNNNNNRTLDKNDDLLEFCEYLEKKQWNDDDISNIDLSDYPPEYYDFRDEE